MTTEIQIVNARVHEDELSKMRGDSDKTLKLWTKPHMSHLNAYRSHSIGGEGLVLAQTSRPLRQGRKSGWSAPLC